MDGKNFNVVNVSLLVVGVLLIVSGVKGKSPKEIFKDSVAQSKKPVAKEPIKGDPNVMTDPNR